MTSTPKRSKFGIVGGLGAIGAADLLMKIIKSTPADGDHQQLDISFEQQPFDDAGLVADAGYNPNPRKFHVYNTLKGMERRGCKVALLPCFVSHSFIDEIAPELDLTVLNMFEATRDMLRREHPHATRIGVVTSSYVRQRRLFDRAMGSAYEVIYPDDAIQTGSVMPAVYGPEGIKAGRLSGRSVGWLAQACDNLTSLGAEVIVLGSTELPVLIEALRPRVTRPILDVNQAYAELALAYDGASPPGIFRLGVVGGVGPAATVDFMDKVVRRTQASRDQDHIKMVVEQNPQIPDRTAHLLGEGEDPTIPLYATCKRLEAEGANAIAIPCNTAHAFVARIQQHLNIPIINMPTQTAAHIRATHPHVTKVGLLATAGTVRSAVYRDALDAVGLTLILPDAETQARVTEAIYGAHGVKAGFTTGRCRDDLLTAINHVGDAGAEAVILGCTELPLIAPSGSALAGLPILLDPTDILARKCVALAKATAR